LVEIWLRKSAESGAVRARIVVPCPWFPFASSRFGHYSLFARQPREEIDMDCVSIIRLFGAAEDRHERVATRPFRPLFCQFCAGSSAADGISIRSTRLIST